MKIIKFLVSGIFAAAVEFTTFLVLQNILTSGSLLVSHSISFLTGFIVSFTLNKFWVFKSRGGVCSELTKYLVLVGINLLTTNAVLDILVNQVGFIYWASKIAVMGMVALWNYFIFQKLIFRSRS